MCECENAAGRLVEKKAYAGVSLKPNSVNDAMIIRQAPRVELSHELCPTVQLSDNGDGEKQRWNKNILLFFDSCTVEEDSCWSFTPGHRR